MGYRGTEGSRTPADWQSQRSGQPRSYSARAALEPADGGPGAPGDAPDDGAGDDDAGYGTGEWAAAHGEGDYGGDAAQGHGAASRGPARGFPPTPGQPDPVYPQDDFDAWSDGTTARDGQAGAPQGPQGQWDSPATGGGWDAAPVGQWESTGQQGEHWGQGEHWDQQEDASPQPWGEGSGQWDAPYGQWDENGEWHSPDEHPEWHSPDEHAEWHSQDEYDGGSGHKGNSHHAGGYDRSDFAIAGRDADRWEAADYPAYDGYPDEPEPAVPGGPGGEEDGSGRRNRRRRGGHGRKGMASPPADDGPSGPGGPGGPGGRGRGAANRKAAGGSRAKIIVAAAASVVVIAALAAITYTLLSNHSRHSGAAAGSSAGISVPKLPTPTAPGSLGTSGASRLGKWGYITSRATDAAPLAVAELYPAQFLISGSSFVRTTERADTDCNQALFGTQLQTAAKVYGCSQVVRASYISGSQTMMGTIGVVNLSSANDAAKAGNASGANDFVTPLDGKTGPTRNLSQGTGVVQAEYKGHYLILIWAEFTNLKAPSTDAQKTQLEQFASSLISGSANIALSNRMVSGQPEVTGTPG